MNNARGVHIIKRNKCTGSGLLWINKHSELIIIIIIIEGLSLLQSIPPDHIRNYSMVIPAPNYHNLISNFV